MLWLLRTDIRDRHLDKMRSTVPATIGWIFIGFFLAFFSQSIAGMIEMYVLGIKPGSENTARLMEIAKTTPWFLIVISIIGPILEEIVFRKFYLVHFIRSLTSLLPLSLVPLYLRRFILILLTYWYTLLWGSYSPSYM